MERSSGPSTHDRTLEAIVDSSRATGRAYVVLALDAEGADPDRLRQLTSTALAAIEHEDGCDRAAASIGLRQNGEEVGLLCAEVGPGVDPAVLGTRMAMSRVAVGVSTSAGHPHLELDDAIAVALEGLDVALTSGASGAVHSELYDLVIGRPAASVRAVGEGLHAEAATAATPAKEEDDPFARDVPGDADAAPPTEPRVPARERAELVLEIEALRDQADELREQDRHARALLERRIAKLARELETAEAEIGRLRDTYEGETGRPSAYRKVQGLDPDEPMAPVKKRMIEGVFRENEDA
ncbi:MAG: hypothetical protein AAF957_29045 [Planctomycetota bacterium]